jgi:arginyl-tRNA synthetase
MSNIFFSIKEKFQQIITQLINNQENSKPIIQDTEFVLEPTKQAIHGDLACNIALVYSKQFQLSALDLAQQITSKLQHHYIKKVEIAKAGFINIFLHPKAYYDNLLILLTQPFSYPNLGNNLLVNLEYASPNPTGPMHVGHTRGAIYGDVLAKLLQKVGYQVLKEYYINDAGKQIDTLLESSYIRYLQACQQNIELSHNHYPGEYLIEIGQKIYQQFGNSLINLDSSQYFPKIRTLVLQEMLNIIKSDLLALKIVHDNYFSEQAELHNTNKINQVIADLTQQGYIYEGILQAPKTNKGIGSLPLEDFCQQNQTLFRSTIFGDDQDRVVKKSDGSFTYFASDLAYLHSKFARGAKLFIMPLGYDHLGYVKRLTAATSIITKQQAKIKIILCQMVKFIQDGKTLKMSKRAGNFITAKQVVEEIGTDALRFLMLTRKNDAPFDFDLNKAIEQSKDNPIFYVQYAHTRCCSALKNVAKEMPELNLKNYQQLDFSLLNSEAEFSLLKKIANFGRVIESSVVNFEPHKIAFYLQELSAEFHSWWHLGSIDSEYKFIIKNKPHLTFARISLLIAIKKIIAEGLDIFNITPLTEMH